MPKLSCVNFSLKFMEGQIIEQNEIWRNWWDDVKRQLAIHCPLPQKRYKRLLEQHILPILGKRKISSLKTTDLDALNARIKKSGGQHERPLSAQSVRHIYALIHRILSEAIEWGWVFSRYSHFGNEIPIK